MTNENEEKSKPVSYDFETSWLSPLPLPWGARLRFLLNARIFVQVKRLRNETTFIIGSVPAWHNFRIRWKCPVVGNIGAS